MNYPRVRFQRVLSLAEAATKTPAELAALRAVGVLPPIAGADGSTDQPAGDPAGDPPAGDPPAGDPPAGDPPAEEYKPPTKEEFEALRQSNAEAQRALREQARAREEADREAAEKKGEHQQLYETEREKNKRLESTIVGRERVSAVERVAKRLQFIAPGVAHKLINIDDIEGSVDLDTGSVSLAPTAEGLIEQRLKELAASENGKGLTRTGKQSPQLPPGGDGGADDPDGSAFMNAAIRGAR